VITPGVTRTEDVVWWMRQRLSDLGLATWFQPSVEVQRRGATAAQLGDNPVIQRGDVLHCDFGISAMRLNTDTQHMGYVLLPGESAPPAGLRAALAASNRLQDIVLAELRPGRTGNEILRASLAAMRAAGIDGTVYSHPDRDARPRRGPADRPLGLPGRACPAAATRASRRACGSRSSCRPRRPCPNGAGSASGRRRRRT
jgi:hypothetical protein